MICYSLSFIFKFFSYYQDAVGNTQAKVGISLHTPVLSLVIHTLLWKQEMLKYLMESQNINSTLESSGLTAH